MQSRGQGSPGRAAIVGMLSFSGAQPLRRMLTRALTEYNAQRPGSYHSASLPRRTLSRASGYLAKWRGRRLEERHEAAAALVGELTYRVWRLYMSASAYSFATGRNELSRRC
jgi:hypothetical protein